MKAGNASVITLLSVAHASEMFKRAKEVEDYGTMRAIGLEVVDNDGITGDASDYHNLSIDFARYDDYVTSYAVIRKGLGLYPFNIDLLADAVHYGSNCGKYDECREHIDVLMSRPFALWNWRAFTFVGDYHLDSVDHLEKADEIIGCYAQALSMAQAFRKVYPQEEKAYSNEFKVRKLIAKVHLDNGDAEEAKAEYLRAEEALKQAIDDDGMTAVTCCLNYADYLFERRRYAETVKCCNRAIQYGEAQPSVNLSYIMYLCAQSEDAMVHSEGAYGDADRIGRVYADYRSAYQMSSNRGHRDHIRQRCLILQARTGIEMPKEIGEPALAQGLSALLAE